MQTIRRKRSWIYLAAIALLLTFVAAPADAFGPSQERMTAEISFPFMIQGEQMDPGTYTFWTADADNPRLMYVEEVGTDDSVAFITMPVPNTWDWDENRRAHLAFKQFGNARFLDGVFVPGHSVARRIPDSDMQEHMKDHDQKPKTAVVLLVDDD